MIMDIQPSIGGLLPLWLILAPLLLGIWDLMRTPDSTRSADARLSNLAGSSSAGIGSGGARLAPR
jgi:hypothetical protein